MARRNWGGLSPSKLHSAVAGINGLGKAGQGVDALRASIIAIVTRVSAAPAIVAQSLGIATAKPQERSLYSVRLEIRTINTLFWIVWGTLSIAIGSVILVLSNPSFGTVTDFLGCALWGFGLPVTGHSLGSLTMTSLNTQLNVSTIRR